MRESQYIERYLQTNAERGRGNGLTVGTYLAYELEGKAASYSWHYQRALINAIERRLADGRAVEGVSAGGRTAYYPVEEVE